MEIDPPLLNAGQSSDLENDTLNYRIANLDASVLHLKTQIEERKSYFDSIIRQYDEYNTLTNTFIHPLAHNTDEANTLRNIVYQKYEMINQSLQNEIKLYRHLTDDFKHFYERLHQHLNEMKQKSIQKCINFFGNSNQLRNFVKVYQQFFTICIETLNILKELINGLFVFFKEQEIYQEIVQKIHDITKEILQSSLIIIKKPPQVIQKNRTFDTDIGLICFGKDYSFLDNIEVKISVLSERALQQRLNKNIPNTDTKPINSLSKKSKAKLQV